MWCEGWSVRRQGRKEGRKGTEVACRGWTAVSYPHPWSATCNLDSSVALLRGISCRGGYVRLRYRYRMHVERTRAVTASEGGALTAVAR